MLGIFLGNFLFFIPIISLSVELLTADCVLSLFLVYQTCL